MKTQTLFLNFLNSNVMFGSISRSLITVLLVWTHKVYEHGVHQLKKSEKLVNLTKGAKH